MRFFPPSLRISQSQLFLGRIPRTRTYAIHTPASVTPSISTAASKAAPAAGEPTSSISSCPPNTVLTGLNYLKDQDPVLALPDSEYPPWLWDLLKPKVYPDDGPGGKGEKMKLRKENRQRIREQNFLKTQRA